MNKEETVRLEKELHAANLKIVELKNDCVPKSVLKDLYDEYYKMRGEYGDGLFWQKNENGAAVDAAQDALGL